MLPHQIERRRRPDGRAGRQLFPGCRGVPVSRGKDALAVARQAQRELRAVAIHTDQHQMRLIAEAGAGRRQPIDDLTESEALVPLGAAVDGIFDIDAIRRETLQGGGPRLQLNHVERRGAGLGICNFWRLHHEGGRCGIAAAGRDERENHRQGHESWGTWRAPPDASDLTAPSTLIARACGHFTTTSVAMRMHSRCSASW